MSEHKGHDEGFEASVNPNTQQNLGFPDASEHDQFIAKLLQDPHKEDALKWLQADDKCTIGNLKTNQDSVEFVKSLCDLGVTDVLAVRIHSRGSAGGERSGKIVAKLPSEHEARARIFDWCKRQGDSLGFSPDPDKGESHLFLLLD
jgi:hypothetical protein